MSAITYFHDDYHQKALQNYFVQYLYNFVTIESLLEISVNVLKILRYCCNAIFILKVCDQFLLFSKFAEAPEKNF